MNGSWRGYANLRARTGSKKPAPPAAMRWEVDHAAIQTLEPHG